jgi:hypothetical protein
MNNKKRNNFTKNCVVGIVQPSYLPWLPFFERMVVSDVFVYLDDVEYSKNSPFNRNDIKTQSGRSRLTVPVAYKGNSSALIRDISTDARRSWRQKHFRSIEQAYSRAPYWKMYRDSIASLYESDEYNLFNINLPIIEFLKQEFEINTPCHISSELSVPGERNEKLRNLCSAFDASHFVVKPNTEDYHPKDEFEPYGLQFAYLTYSRIHYTQLHGEFEQHLSALDYLLNRGPGLPPFQSSLTLSSTD